MSYFIILLFIICAFCSVTVILLHCGSFCHENKFLVCVNISGNKAHSDSDSVSKHVKCKVDWKEEIGYEKVHKQQG